MDETAIKPIYFARPSPVKDGVYELCVEYVIFGNKGTQVLFTTRAPDIFDGASCMNTLERLTALAEELNNNNKERI